MAEMTQALYAHTNNKRKKKEDKVLGLNGFSKILSEGFTFTSKCFI
jgi:hypothetical protein